MQREPNKVIKNALTCQNMEVHKEVKTMLNITIKLFLNVKII